ncbi:MAG: hypothetical protein M3Z75_30785 [Actinomycetota bacterium]|nr:hypothetical protein [Actinomycetota bacterium]
MASEYPEEGRSASDGGDEPGRLPFRPDDPGHPAQTEARAELRDRETYYIELRFAVHCQSRSLSPDPSAPGIPAPRTSPDDQESDTWTGTSHEAANAGAARRTEEESAARRTEEESWDEMVARFGDTWT